MKAAEVWRVPIGEGKQCWVRVVLAVKDLELPPGHPMAFVENCVLVQVSQSGAEKFEPNSVLVDGVFLAANVREVQRSSFERIGHLRASLDEIEFPCWLIDRAKAGVLFCRGEIQRPLPSLSAQEVYRRWDVRLSPHYPAQLVDSIHRLEAQRAGDRDASPRRVLGIPGSDARYHPNRSDILRDVGVDISEPYWKAIERADPRRLEVYARATGKP